MGEALQEFDVVEEGVAEAFSGQSIDGKLSASISTSSVAGISSLRSTIPYGIGVSGWCKRIVEGRCDPQRH